MVEVGVHVLGATLLAWRTRDDKVRAACVEDKGLFLRWSAEEEVNVIIAQGNVTEDGCLMNNKFRRSRF